MALYSRVKTWVAGEILYAADLNAEFDNILTNAKPQSIEDLSVNEAQMQQQTNPGTPGSASLATSLAGELERIRYVLNQIKGTTYWYDSITNNLTTAIIPIGSVVPYSGDADTGNWFVCDGRAISRTTYATLFALVNERFGQGDNSTTFNIPDARGRFVRGRDATAGRDPDAAGRTAMNTGGATGDAVGSLQAYATATTGITIPNHTHTVERGIDSTAGNNTGNLTPGSGATQGTAPTSSTALALAGGGNETRPINFNLNYIIRVL